MLLMFSLLVIEMLIGICYSLLFQICTVFFSMFVCGIHPPSLPLPLSDFCHVWYILFGFAAVYFSQVYLFWASLQRNLLTSKPKTRHPKHLRQTKIFQQPFTPKPFCTGHYIPYITRFFPQPEKPKSRAPSFLEKLATLLLPGLPPPGLPTAKLTQFIPFDLAPQSL